MLDAKQIESVLAANVTDYTAAHVWLVHKTNELCQRNFVLKRIQTNYSPHRNAQRVR